MQCGDERQGSTREILGAQRGGPFARRGGTKGLARAAQRRQVPADARGCQATNKGRAPVPDRKGTVAARSDAVPRSGPANTATAANATATNPSPGCPGSFLAACEWTQAPDATTAASGTNASGRSQRPPPPTFRREQRWRPTSVGCTCSQDTHPGEQAAARKRIGRAEQSHGFPCETTDRHACTACAISGSRPTTQACTDCGGGQRTSPTTRPGFASRRRQRRERAECTQLDLWRRAARVSQRAAATVRAAAKSPVLDG
jgi:hypothetical protein